jgi:endonuclease G
MKIKSVLTFLILILYISRTSSSQKLLPASTTGQIVKHTYYTVSYCENDEQPEWVYYELTSEMVRGRQPRSDDYRPDFQISTMSAQLED